MTLVYLLTYLVAL